MEHLTEQEKVRQERIHKWCMVAYTLEILLIVALVFVLTLLPNAHALHNAVGLTLAGSFVPVLIAIRVSSRLEITQHVAAGDYSLPYKLHKEKTRFYMIGGCILLISLLLMPAILRGNPVTLEQYKGGPVVLRLPGWTVLPLVIWGPTGFLAWLVSWQGATLFEDHLLSHVLWMKHKVLYRDMHRVDVQRRPTGKGANTYVMVINHRGAGKSPLEIDLTWIPAKDCTIMLSVIETFAPRVVMGEIALQMKNGDFPVV